MTDEPEEKKQVMAFPSIPLQMHPELAAFYQHYKSVFSRIEAVGHIDESMAEGMAEIVPGKVILGTIGQFELGEGQKHPYVHLIKIDSWRDSRDLFYSNPMNNGLERATFGLMSWAIPMMRYHKQGVEKYHALKKKIQQANIAQARQILGNLPVTEGCIEDLADELGRELLPMALPDDPMMVTPEGYIRAPTTFHLKVAAYQMGAEALYDAVLPMPKSSPEDVAPCTPMAKPAVFARLN